MRRLILALVCLPGMASAQTLEVGQVLRGHFVQERHLKGFNAPLRTEGSFVLAPGKGLIWRAEKPFAVTTVITAAGRKKAASIAQRTEGVHRVVNRMTIGPKKA